jgi:hypothetical protein
MLRFREKFRREFQHSVCTSTRFHVSNPVILNGFVPPKIQGRIDRPRGPSEFFGEDPVRPELLEPDKFNLELASGFSASRSIYGQGCCPFSLLILRLRKPNILERQRRLASKLRRGWCCHAKHQARDERFSHVPRRVPQPPGRRSEHGSGISGNPICSLGRCMDAPQSYFGSGAFGAGAALCDSDRALARRAISDGACPGKGKTELTLISQST